MNPFITFVASIIAVLFLSTAVRKTAERIFPPRLLLVLFFPGIVLHEIFHAVASLLVGAKVHKIKFFSLSGGSVLHEKPRLPFGQLIISFAPFVGGIILIVLASNFFDPHLSYSADGGYLELTQSINFWRTIVDNLFSLWFWLWLYVVYSVSMTMLPSWRDAQNSITVLAFVALILVFVFGGGFLDPNVAIFQRLNRMLFTVLSLLASLFVISGVLYAVKNLQRKSR